MPVGAVGFVFTVNVALVFCLAVHVPTVDVTVTEYVPASDVEALASVYVTEFPPIDEPLCCH